MCYTDFPLGLLLRLLGRATATVSTIVKGFSTIATATIIGFIGQQVVDTVSRTATCLMQLRVEQSEGRHLADTFVSQQLVYNVVCRFVPPLVLTFATAEVVFQHGVEALMGYNKLAFLIVQVVHEVRVVANLLAIGNGSTA